MPACLPPPPRPSTTEIALFLDVDGTLVEIEREPDAVRVPEHVRAVLGDLQLATDGALALVSGRTLTQLDHLFAPLRLSAAGLHGLERRNVAGEIQRGGSDSGILDRARVELSAFARATPGILLEDKGLTLALHYRNAPDAADAAKAIAQDQIAASNGALVLLQGKMVLELKPPGFDKGVVIETFMAEPPFAGRRPVFAGDDVTDEAGFAAVNDLGGITIRIGNDRHDTAAAYGHCDVTAMHRWLGELLTA